MNYSITSINSRIGRHWYALVQARARFQIVGYQHFSGGYAVTFRCIYSGANPEKDRAGGKALQVSG